MNTPRCPGLISRRSGHFRPIMHSLTARPCRCAGPHEGQGEGQHRQVAPLYSLCGPVPTAARPRTHLIEHRPIVDSYSSSIRMTRNRRFESSSLARASVDGWNPGRLSCPDAGPFGVGLDRDGAGIHGRCKLFVADVGSDEAATSRLPP
jgi:hypothetical protein